MSGFLPSCIVLALGLCLHIPELLSDALLFRRFLLRLLFAIDLPLPCGQITVVLLHKGCRGVIRPHEDLYIGITVLFEDARQPIHTAVNFLQETVNWYDADVFSAPMDQSTVDDINRWVSNHTDGMIEQIISDLPPATLMCLVNALMFKANWGDPYECTVDRSFFMEDGTEKTVPMLAGTEHYYINDGNAEGFVKYYQERRYAFAVLMPTNEEPLSDYVKSLTGSGIGQTLENKTAYDAVHAYMPKFEASTELDLVSPLQRMGIRTVFDPYCSELSGMTDWYPCWISNVRQNAVIKVDENGTSAAAATSVIEPGGSAPDPEHEITVVIDHPYVYMILDMENNIPLFIGTQYNP